MSRSRSTSSFGQYTGAPVAFASGATAPTWSTSVWVIRIASIATLLDRYPDETLVLPGHMATTTLGAERETNPFLQELAK